MTTDEVAKKMAFNLPEMESMRQHVLDQQRLLKHALDKVITLHIPESERTDPNEHSLEFRANSWTAIHQVVQNVLADIRQTIGMAHGLLFDVQMDGFEAIAGVLYTGVEFNTITLPVDTILRNMGGVLQVIDGSPDVLETIKGQREGKFFTNENIFIPAGQKLKLRVIHRTYFLMQFVPSKITNEEQFFLPARE